MSVNPVELEALNNKLANREKKYRKGASACFNPDTLASSSPDSSINHLSADLSSKLENLQNRAIRVLTFSNYECSTSELFQSGQNLSISA